MREPRATTTIGGMPSLRPHRPRPPRRPRRPGTGPRQADRLRVVVVGDLMLDVVLAPTRPLESGTDVPGRIALTQGGSAATTARWLARLGARSSLVAAVGRDAAGRALVEAIRVGRRDRPGRPHRGWPHGPHRRARRSGRRAQLRGRSRGGRSPRSCRSQDGLVRRRGGRASAGLFAARPPARHGRTTIDRAGTGGRRCGQPRPRLDRAAARRGPGDRDRAGSLDPARLPVHDGRRGRPPSSAHGRQTACWTSPGPRSSSAEPRARPC